MEALITDIQRFSLTDGDGIRTTVFFKGCNMNCSWCHNPETISGKRELMFYENKCIGCRKCFEVCPQKAHKIENNKHITDRNLCTSCGMCASVCYAEALTMCGKSMSIEDVVFQVEQDIPYYNSSNGGVTLSGGEVLMQKDFALELTERLHEKNIGVAVETNLNFPFESIKEVLSAVDFIMCDLKIFDDEKHKKYTGVSNENILKNIKLIDGLNKKIIVRTPLIPGATDDINNIKEIATFVKDLKNLKRYELLNFNPLGEGKYKALDKNNDFIDARPFKNEYLKKYDELLKELGINYKIV